MIELKPDYAEAYASRGDVNSLKCEYCIAIADYTKAFELKLEDARIHYNRGVDFWNKRQFDKAIVGLFGKAIQLNPDYNTMPIAIVEMACDYT